MAYNWTGHGLDDKFGAADYAAALAAGKSRAQIKSYLASNPGTKRVGTKIDSLLAGDQGGLRSDIGVSRDASGVSTPTSSQLQQFGRADERHARAVLAERGITGQEADLQISEYMKGVDVQEQFTTSSYGQALEGRAGSERILQQGQAHQLEQMKILQQQLAQAQEAEEQRKLDRMKIRFQGTTKADNPTARGVMFKRSPTFKGSNLTGTAQLARSTAGRQLTNINV
jgi:hypothetical protein